MNDAVCVLCAEPIDYCQGHPDEWKRIAEVINDSASEETIERIKDHLISGRAKWYWDPYVDNVAGLIKPGTNSALMVVYPEHEDFECSADFWEGDVEDADQ